MKWGEALWASIVVAPGLKHDEGCGIVAGHAQVIGDIARLRPGALDEPFGKRAELLDGVGTDAESGDDADHELLLTCEDAGKDG